MTLSKKKKPAAASSVVSGEALGMDANIAMLVKERNANNAWHKLARNKTALVGFFIVAFMVVIAVFLPRSSRHMTRTRSTRSCPLRESALPDISSARMTLAVISCPVSSTAPVFP